MSTKGSTIPERIARWKVIHSGLRPLLPEMPYLTELHTGLEGVITQSEALDARNEALKAESREVTRLRDELARSGDDLRNRLGAALRTTYGFTSEKLIEFGIPPRRGRGRDRKSRAARKASARAAAVPAEPAADDSKASA